MQLFYHNTNMYLDRLLVDRPGVCDSIDFSCSLDVNIEHVMSLCSFYCLRCSFIDSHGMARQSILLLQFGIQQVNGWKDKMGTKAQKSLSKDLDEAMWNIEYTSVTYSLQTLQDSHPGLVQINLWLSPVSCPHNDQ